jgi:hypothetical protein
MGDAGRFLDAHPALRTAVQASPWFDALRRRAMIEIDGERLYVVRGDTLGSEEDLIVEALVRGARSIDPDDPHRRLYEELDGDLRAIVDARISQSRL